VQGSLPMATNKNQHFVPRCYLRPFTLDGGNAAINVFNVDRLRFITGAPVKNQCSGDYFYGEDLALERALQTTEGEYAGCLSRILSASRALTDEDKLLLLRFWLLQYLRTEAASRRSVEMAEGMRDLVGAPDDFGMSIKEAVQESMRVFVDKMDVVDDLKVVLIRNRTGTQFVTSDDPAVLHNKWHLDDARTLHSSHGLHQAGAVLVLPLAPQILFVAYDGDVYTIPSSNGWADAVRDQDVRAWNEHQYLNCRANIFVRDAGEQANVRAEFLRIAPRKPTVRHRFHYAVRDITIGNHTRYRVVNPEEGRRHAEAIVHTETVHARVLTNPSHLIVRANGSVFTNGTGVGYVRHSAIPPWEAASYRRERVAVRRKSR
jgi:hypothetical protein